MKHYFTVIFNKTCLSEHLLKQPINNKTWNSKKYHLFLLPKWRIMYFVRLSCPRLTLEVHNSKFACSFKRKKESNKDDTSSDWLFFCHNFNKVTSEHVESFMLSSVKIWANSNYFNQEHCNHKIRHILKSKWDDMCEHVHQKKEIIEKLLSGIL